MEPVLVWFEDNLRTRDHPALAAAVGTGKPVVPVFCWEGGTGWAEGGAARWWLHHSLDSLAAELEQLGSPLIVRAGQAANILPKLVVETGARRVLGIDAPSLERRLRNRSVAQALRNQGAELDLFGGGFLHDPARLRTGTGEPYKMFTPFYRRFRAENPVPSPEGGPGALRRPSLQVSSSGLAALGLLPKWPREGGLARVWNPGVSGAVAALDRVSSIADYDQTRDLPADDGTTRISAHMHFGEISPSQAWQAAEGIEALRRQLVWREFAHHLFVNYPQTATQPLKPAYNDFPWRYSNEELARWRAGQTGYPMVDAGMRQLRETGWMHNRARMVVASFLTKHLLHDWRHGQAWFWDNLVDADLANNVLGWQWAAGCGADAQPFFRIFNPILQGKKFDREGHYVRRWIPELRDMSATLIHEPWKAPLEKGRYPDPLVEHRFARQRALDAYAEFRNRTHQS